MPSSYCPADAVMLLLLLAALLLLLPLLPFTLFMAVSRRVTLRGAGSMLRTTLVSGPASQAASSSSRANELCHVAPSLL
jgi:hypothetical protein